MILESICYDYLERFGIQSKQEKEYDKALDKLLEAYKAGKQNYDDLRTEFDCLIGEIESDYLLAGVRLGIQIVVDGMGGKTNG